MRALALIERLDQRLDNAHSAVVRTRITPRFEIMRFRNLPMTKLGSFIAILTEMNPQLRHLEHPIFVELKISRRVVNGIAADDNQQLNVAVVNVVNQLLQ